LLCPKIHKRFTLEQVKVLLSSYENGNLSRSDIQEVLGIGKTRFFEILKRYRTDPGSFSIDYKRNNKYRLIPAAEEKIRLFLEEEKALIDNPDLPIHTYDYSAINDRLKENAM
jgi:seryl-tRNA synthetase